MVKRERKGNFKGIFLISLSRRSEIFFVGGREGLLVKMSFKGVWQHRLMTFFGIRGGNEELEGITEAKRVSAG